MKYPQRFTLLDRGNGYEVDMKYDSAKGVYLADYGDGNLAEFSEDHVDGLIEDYYDVVEYDKKVYQYPDSFQFTHDTTSQVYDMVKLKNHGLWACTQPGLQCVGTGATYTAEEIAGHFAEGHWKEVSFAEAQEERSLPLPFTFYVEHGTKILYEASHELDNRVYILWEGCEEGTTYSVESVKNFIKNGTWRVTSVGPQASTAPPAPSKEAAKGLDRITIKVSSEGVVEATERVKRLAQAVEDLNISLESLQSIFAETREIVFGVNRHCEAEDNQCQHFDFSSFIKCD